MSLNNFIPEVWSAQILSNLHKTHIFCQSAVCNRNYEGEIKKGGDTVRINNIGAVTVSDYTKDTDIASAQALTDGQQTLVIEKAKYFNFSIDDIDKAQGNPMVMDEAMREAAYAMSDAQDTYVAGLWIYAASANFVGTDISPKTLSAASDLYPLFTQLKTVLDTNNVPREGRYIILPPWCESVMAQDNRFVLNYNPAVYGTILNGQITKAVGFDVLISNNITNDGSSDYRIQAGHNMAITYADQVTEVEAYRPQLRFGDALKGLNLFGAKVVRPQALAIATITKPSFA